MSRFVDAHPDVRCEWGVSLRDMSGAQCGRRLVDDDHLYCWQHQKMLDAAREIAYAHREKLNAAFGRRDCDCKNCRIARRCD